MEAVEIIGAIVVGGLTVLILTFGGRRAWSVLRLGRGGLCSHEKADVEDIRPQAERAINHETEVK